jgi:nucleoid-associated protein YgaU
VASLRWLEDEDSVTAARKLLLAAAIVAAGYGGAFLLGGPNPLPTFQVASRAGEKCNGSPPLAVAPPNFNYWSPNSLPPGNARLVPDPQGEAASHFRLRGSNARVEETLASAEPTASNSARTESIHPPELVRPVTEAPLVARGKLLNEAPRPILSGSPSMPTQQQLQSPWAANSQNRQIAVSEVRQDVPSHVVSAQFSNATGTRNDVNNAYATAIAPTGSTTNGAASLAPLPLMSVPQAEEPRSHIVVDGDSLAKLAGRYLDDPHRAAEIYELNRRILANPDLLPIGVELEIPSRSAVAGAAATSPQSFMQRTVAIHAPAASGLVPVRPIPRATRVTPRAFLAAPRRAD